MHDYFSGQMIYNKLYAKLEQVDTMREAANDQFIISP